MNQFERVPADDEEVPVVEYREASPATVVAEAALAGLREEAVSAQRLVVSRLVSKYVPGRMELAVAEYGRKMAAEKMFNVVKLVEWVEGDPSVIVEALDAGRLRCRLSATMGLGKSTRLASYVARAMNYRVLHVALDALALQQMAVYVVEKGIGRVSRHWTRAKCSRVCCMTYAEFNGHMATTRRSELFKSFDLIIFDEAIVASADVFVAKRCFSVYASPDISLILCSATIREDVSVEDMGSKSMGAFKQLTSGMSLSQAMDSGKLIKDYLQDRTMVVLPTNDEVQQASEYYAAYGVDVRMLDDADSYEVLRDVVEWLLGDTTVPRVLVAHAKYAIAFNLPVAYSIIWPFESGVKCDDESIETVVFPMSEEMVVQAKSRSGRGIVDGSGGLVMSPERAPVVELAESEKMEAFVKLCAASIRPLEIPFWASCYARFPDGLTPATAMTVLKVCMPVEVVVKYLGSDGRVASRYCRALNVFSQPDHFLVASDDEMPTCFDGWVVDYLGLGESEEDGYEEIKVPVRAVGELKVILAAVEMIAQKRMEIPRWRPARLFAMGDGYDSEEEVEDSRYGDRKIHLRRIEDAQGFESRVEAPKRIPWEYRSVDPGVPEYRRGGFINSDRCRQALLELEQSLLAYRVPPVVISEVEETDEGTMAAVVADGFRDVESPGGSVVCKLPLRICERLNVGKTLSADEFLKLSVAAKLDVDRFVASKMFDCYAGPWEGILRSLLVEEVARAVVKSGIAGDVYMMVDRLRARFSLELCSVLAGSFIFKKRFLRVFRKAPSMDDMMQAINLGRFDGVAQTDGFIERVKLLKELIDRVLLAAESQNVFLPTYITSAQRALPLRGTSHLGYDGDTVFQMPKRIAKRLEAGSSGRSRGGSFDTKRAGW